MLGLVPFAVLVVSTFVKSPLSLVWAKSATFAATTRIGFPVLRDLNGEASSFQLSSIQTLNGRLGFRVIAHFYESKTPAFLCLSVHDHPGGTDRTIGFKYF